MMAYIKQFFIDLGSAYSFLEGIQIWLGNWNTCMLHFLKREKASVLIFKRKLAQINKPRLGSWESFVPVKIKKKIILILLLYFWRTEQRYLIEVDRVCMNWRLSKSPGYFYPVTCPYIHNGTSQESQLSSLSWYKPLKVQSSWIKQINHRNGQHHWDGEVAYTASCKIKGKNWA